MQHRRDVKLAQKRGKDMAKLREVIVLLIEGKPLPPRYKDHPLGGDWKHFRDCHIEPDWLLIYRVDGDGLYLVRTGRTQICSEVHASRGLSGQARAKTILTSVRGESAWADCTSSSALGLLRA